MSNQITLAGGCFWCTEAIFQRIKGVLKVESGYANSKVENPDYWAVASDTTGAAEAIQITFDSKVIPLEELLDIFFRLHDPTTLNKQGADKGSEYRSAIFYQDENQKKVAEEALKIAETSGIYQDKFTTEISPLKNFYKAEDYHQDFYNNNKNSPYCQVVIDPKIQKLLKDFKEKVV